MKPFFCLFFTSMMLLFSCEKDETGQSFDSPTKLLVGIKQNDKLITEFKYDSINRLIQLNLYHADTISYSELFEYNSENKLIKRTYVGFIEIYKYFNDGKLKSSTKYYQATNKEWHTKYLYKNDKINKGINYFNGSESGRIEYKYDSRGNTIERTVYPNWSIDAIFMDEQFKLSYDDKICPIKNMSIFPIDMVIKSNPTYFYHYLSVMSSFPPEYNSTYDYDAEGLPLKEYKTPVRESQSSQVFVYEYTDRKP